MALFQWQRRGGGEVVIARWWGWRRIREVLADIEADRMERRRAAPCVCDPVTGSGCDSDACYNVPITLRMQRAEGDVYVHMSELLVPEITGPAKVKGLARTHGQPWD